jgi:hypothetical protein
MAVPGNSQSSRPKRRVMEARKYATMRASPLGQVSTALSGALLAWPSREQK